MDASLRSKPMVFVRDLDCPILDSEDRKHLYSSLRLVDGDPICVADGLGSWRSVELGSTLVPVSDIRFSEAPSPSLGVAFVPVKSVKPETTIRALTQLGMNRIYIVTSLRSVVRPKADRTDRQAGRWAKAAKEASRQSRSLWIPRVSGPIGLDQLVSTEEVVFCEPGGQALRLALGPKAKNGRLTVAVGPEGGWASEELEGKPQVSLPGGVLRAETASIAAATLLGEVRALGGSFG